MKILRAVYGSDQKQVDVTAMVRSLFDPGRRCVELQGGYNRHFGDPHHRRVKQLVIEYEIDGTRTTRTFVEDSRTEIRDTHVIEKTACERPDSRASFGCCGAG